MTAPGITPAERRKPDGKAVGIVVGALLGATLIFLLAAVPFGLGVTTGWYGAAAFFSGSMTPLIDTVLDRRRASKAAQ